MREWWWDVGRWEAWIRIGLDGGLQGKEEEKGWVGLGNEVMGIEEMV